MGKSENKEAAEKVARVFRAHGWVAEVFEGYAVSSPWPLVPRPGSVAVELEWVRDDKNEYAFHLAAVDDGECVERGAGEAWRTAIMEEIATLCPAECYDPSVDLARTRLLAREFPTPFAEAMAAIGVEGGDPIPDDAEMVVSSLCKGELERIAAASADLREWEARVARRVGAKMVAELGAAGLVPGLEDAQPRRVVEASFDSDALACCGIDASKVGDLSAFLDECAARYARMSEGMMERAAWAAAEALGLDAAAIMPES